MTYRMSVAAALIVAGLGLGACTSETEGTASLVKAGVDTIVGRAKGDIPRRGERPPDIVVTQEQLENTKVAAMQINVETRGGGDILRRTSLRNDANPGQVAVWGGNSATQVFLRNGVLIGTRGIGGDIISADVNATVRAVSSARAGNGERRYFVSNGAYSDVEVVLSCDIDNLGRTTTQVVHLVYQTVHLRETCVGGEDNRVRIVNEYWVQPGSGIVRRSRQWAGPNSGYFEFILLRN